MGEEVAKKEKKPFVSANWMKLVLITLLTLVGVFAFLVMVNAWHGLDVIKGEAGKKISNAMMGEGFAYFAIVISSLALIAFIVMNMVAPEKKKIASMVLVACAALATVFFIVSIGLGAAYVKELKEAVDFTKSMNGLAPTIVGKDAVSAARWMYFSAIAQTITYLVVFGLIPLVFGLKKLLCGGCAKEETKE